MSLSEALEIQSETPFFTAIISDLHLCEEESVHEKFPLWKKYKTKEFFFDEVFCDFLQKLENMAEGKPIELVLNGDIFDFDSITSVPEQAPYRVSWLEKCRGLHPQEEKSLYKIQCIVEDHGPWFEGLKTFLGRGNIVIFVIGNHDLELHYLAVQSYLLSTLGNPNKNQLRFVEWFYISNKDTLIEHGNQYDPYCLCQDPVNPIVHKGSRMELRLPFGNLATRYLINGMGYFNPHVDTNYLMTISEYLKFFFRYMVRAQPLIIWSWFWGATITMAQAVTDRMRPALRDPISIEGRIEQIAKRANATPGMVRQMKELFVAPAASFPWLLARELWLDRAIIFLLSFFLVTQTFIWIDRFFHISVMWGIVPMLFFLPPFIFYSKSFSSHVTRFKEPHENILMMASMITNVNRVVYGHTHISRHEIIGSVEHLNPGTWSPAFLDVECRNSVDQKNFVWISPNPGGLRRAQLLKFEEGNIFDAFKTKRQNQHEHEKVVVLAEFDDFEEDFAV